MPVYEYICNNCSGKFATLVGVLASSGPPVCPECGGVDLDKLMSRFSAVRSDDFALDSLVDMVDPDDASSMRNLISEVKEELSGFPEEEFMKLLTSVDADELEDGDLM